jgi:hypothetical protein
MAKTLLYLLLLTAVVADECDWAPDPNAKPNNYPIDTAAPVLNRTTTNGKAYVAGQPGFQYFIAHLYGSDYEMGRVSNDCVCFLPKITHYLRRLTESCSEQRLGNSSAPCGRGWTSNLQVSFTLGKF